MNVKYLFSRFKYRSYIFLSNLKKMNVKQNKKRIFVFGTVEHMNYGDIAINDAEYEFLAKVIPNYEIVAIPERMVAISISKVKRIINETDIVAFHGGGNMGDIWEQQEDLRREVFQTFKDFMIISFPQSTSFFDLNNYNFKQSVKVYGQLKNAYFFSRDQESFDFMKKHFPTNLHVYLIPDMVLSLTRYSEDDADGGILTLLRRDREKLTNNTLITLLQNISKTYNLTLSDTVGNYWKIITKKTISNVLNERLNEIGKAKIIITDRLHGMVFAVITGTPAIVFDNNNHKIKHLYETWLKKINYIYFVRETDKVDFLQKKIEFMVNEKSEKNFCDFTPYFSTLTELLKNKDRDSN